MDVISLDEYRRTGRIQKITATERLKKHLEEKLRQRLRARMKLEELKKNQPDPPRKKTPI